jgi:radical SAM superfamily enzyme YgiQ (UPF0313 family)
LSGIYPGPEFLQKQRRALVGVTDEMENPLNPGSSEVWLAELTHTGQTIASETIPLAPGMLAAYCRKSLGNKFKYRLFKFPERLIEACLTGPPPKVVGFTNYLWNCNLSHALAVRIKKIYPSAVILFGGPNYPLEEAEQINFFKKYSAIDFYITGEGEKALAQLLERLLINGFNTDEVKSLSPSNCHFWFNGKFIRGPILERMDIKEIPSPYLNGQLDEFFEHNMMPLVQTVRGCPFNCTYCCEGQSYFRKMSFRDPGQIKKELIYIAVRTKNANLNIADSNFGQFSQDLKTARAISYIQKEYGFPKYIHVATGKMNQLNVAEISRIVGGALRLSASVQSTDAKVLKKINRMNVPIDTLIGLIRNANRTGSNTYSEIILGLPGDSKKAHLASIERMIDLGLNFIRCYTLMLLSGSDLATRSSISKNRLTTKFRVLPRCFGIYKFGKEAIPLVEIEEVCVASQTLSFKDYIDCRLFDLTVEIFYNDGILEELLVVLKKNEISANELLRNIFSRIHQFPRGLLRLYHDFSEDTQNELWDSAKDLEKFATHKTIISRYIQGEYGSNLIFKYKSLSLIRHIEQIHDVAFDTAKILLGKKRNIDLKNILNYLDELKIFSLFQKKNLLAFNQNYQYSFCYNMKQAVKKSFQINTSELLLKQPQQIEFRRDLEQENILRNHINQFGITLIGISRILSRMYIKKMYRKPIFN